MNANKSTHRSWSCFLFLWRRLAEMVLYVRLMSFSIWTSSVDKGTFFNIYVNIFIFKKIKILHWHINLICKKCFFRISLKKLKKSLTKRNKAIPMHRVVDLIAPCCIVECAEELPNKSRLIQRVFMSRI